MEKKKTDTTYYANKYLQLGKDFSIVQKRVIHFVVDQLQKEMYALNEQRTNGRAIKRTLFGDAYFLIPVKLIDPNNQDQQVRNALRGLKIPIDDENFIGDFMLSATRRKGQWQLLFPEKTVHFLTEVSKGVTPLQTVVYLTAKSKYTIRMYELLMRFRVTGFWYTTPEDLCHLLELAPSYKRDFGRLRQSVLDVAQKELRILYNKKQSDIYFTYEDKRGGRGNKVQQLKFKIYMLSKNNETITRADKDYIFTLDNLLRIMVDQPHITKHQKAANKEFINRAMSKLVETNQIKSFAQKLEAKILGNPKVDYSNKGALARYILTEDYGV